MEKVIINSEAGLLRLLKKIEESKRKETSRFQDDPRQVYFSQAHKRDMKTFELEEEEELSPEEDPDAPATGRAPSVPSRAPEIKSKPQPAQQAPKAEPTQSPEPAPATKSQKASASIDPSLDTITQSVNTIRGSKSLKDPSVKEELRTYFDRLDPSEKLALQAFIMSFAELLSGKVTGLTAADPQDPPFNLQIKQSNEPESDEEPATPVSASGSETDTEEEEDTTPPISVDKTQVKEGIRRKFLSLSRK